jgi:hypothetical protein
MFRPTRRALLSSALVALSMASFGGPAVAADPRGNNGTIKVDARPFDDVPDNESHPSCVFEVDFYGFDQGALWATATFTLISPTVDVDTVFLTSDPVYIGDDPASGAGTTSGLDASRTFDLNGHLWPYMGDNGKGAHVKLAVHADGASSVDTKYKTFWVTGCEFPNQET